jgi:hypothetical protein
MDATPAAYNRTIQASPGCSADNENIEISEFRNGNIISVIITASATYEDHSLRQY